MAFPEDILPTKNEILVDGTWIDVTPRTRGNQEEIRITRGFSGEGQFGISAGQCSMVLGNPDGVLSNRNPNSAYYGKVGKNVQFRTSVTESEVSLRLADHSTITDFGYDQAKAYTADKAVLDITGDIDLRVDCLPDNWQGGIGQTLMSKHVQTGNQRSWFLYVDRFGYPIFVFSSAGTTNTVCKSTASVPDEGRLAIRVTLDVNNGAGGFTVAFYTAPTIDGSWTQLGSFLVGSGTTSIFSSTSDVQIGHHADSGRLSLVFSGLEVVGPFIGKVYRAQVYNGIAGTLVADFDPDGQAPGTTSWSDGLGTPNTWLLNTSAEITDADYRFWGEFPDIPQTWDPTGTDVKIRATGSDLIGRMLQGSKALQSSMYRNIMRFARGATGTSGTLDSYHPLEQGSTSTKPAPAVGGGGAMVDALFSVDPDWPASEGVLTFTADTGQVAAIGVPAGETATTGVVCLMFAFRAPAVPVGGTRLDIMSFPLFGGTAARVDVGVNDTNYHLNIYNSSNTNIYSLSSAFGSGASPDQPVFMRVLLEQNGANVDASLAWYIPVDDSFLGFGPATAYAGTVGRPRGWTSKPFTGKSGWWISHVATMREDPDFTSTSFRGGASAWLGEHPDGRFNRLCREQGIQSWIVGRPYLQGKLSEPMGAQTVQPFMTLLAEAADMSGGFLYAPRNKFGLALRLGSSLTNRGALELDYSAGHLSGELTPRDDPFFVRNDVTVTRDGGGFARAVKTTGPNNVNEPSDDPEGIGTYDPGPVTRNAESDDQLPDLAEEIVFRGTWDELRYPNVSISLARAVHVASPERTARIRALDLGSPLKLVNLPVWLPPDDPELMAIGYTEVLGNVKQDFVFNTQPYGPYRNNDLTSSDLSVYRAGATNSYLATDITSSATTVPVGTPEGKLWGTTAGKPGNFPLNVRVGGEEMTVSGIGSWLADTFTRSESNGWGSTSTGSFPWTSTGTASHFSTNGTVGVHNLASAGTVCLSSLDLAARVTYLRLERFHMPANVTGAGGNASASIRIGTTTDYVSFNMQFETAGTGSHWLAQVVGGVETTFDGSFPSTGVTATTAVSIILKITPTAAYGKIWAQGTNEPSGWTTSITLTAANAAGDLFLRTTRNASSTNGNPFYMEWDGLTLPRIQAFEVDSRNENGMALAKAHSMDDFVQVAQPSYVTR